MSLPSQPFATHEPEVKGRAQPEREPQRQRRLAAAPLTPARVAVATGAGVARHDQLGGHQPPPRRVCARARPDDLSRATGGSTGVHDPRKIRKNPNYRACHVGESSETMPERRTRGMVDPS